MGLEGTKNHNGLIGNRIRDLPACSAVPILYESSIKNMATSASFVKIGVVGAMYYLRAFCLRQ